jgi:hypothetical protein
MAVRSQSLLIVYAHTRREERIFIGIQNYVRNDFKGVPFLYVAVNVEPYENMQIMFLCNKLLCPWMDSKRLSQMFCKKAV